MLGAPGYGRAFLGQSDPSPGKAESDLMTLQLQETGVRGQESPELFQGRLSQDHGWITALRLSSEIVLRYCCPPHGHNPKKLAGITKTQTKTNCTETVFLGDRPAAVGRHTEQRE